MRGIPGAKKMREKMMRVSTIEGLEEALERSVEPEEAVALPGLD